MDLRFTVFNLLFRDAVLRKLLINYADRIELGKAVGEAPVTNCFLALKWTNEDRMSIPGVGPQILTARAHLPSYCWSEHLYLNSALRRVQVTLHVGVQSESIRAELLRTSCAVTKIGSDTIFKSSTLKVTPTAPQMAGNLCE